MILSRRLALQGALVSAALAAARAAKAAPGASAPLDVAPIIFPDLAAELNALMRVELSLDGTDTGSWFRWTAFIVTEDRQPIPFVNFEGLELARLVKLPNGKHFCTGIDLSYPRDFATGQFCETAFNPVTGKTVAVPVSVITNDPGYVVSVEDGWRPRFAPKPTKVDLHSHWWREGDQGQLQRIRTPPPSFPHPMIEQSYSRFSYADLMNPKVANVRYETSGIYTYPFPKWLEMGDRPGHMLGSITGRKIASVKELPREFATRTEREHPELLNLDWMFKTLPAIS